MQGMVKLAMEAYLFEREESCPHFGHEIQRTRPAEGKKVLTSERDEFRVQAVLPSRLLRLLRCVFYRKER
jgi:hypothetical protein